MATHRHILSFLPFFAIILLKTAASVLAIPFSASPDMADFFGFSVLALAVRCPGRNPHDAASLDSCRYPSSA
jgi:hypothetical protein